MTDAASYRHPAGDDPAAVQAAGDAARRIADGAGVRVESLVDTADLTAVVGLYNDIWGPTAHPPVTAELLRALVKTGNYVSGAFSGSSLVGAAVGFFSSPGRHALHSHIAGVLHAARGRDVGFALKAHQRAWGLRRGVEVIEWTFDPLVRRNAHFNLVKLGASVVEYLPDFYGDMRDELNRGDDSDRLLVRWPLAADHVVALCNGRPLVRVPVMGDRGRLDVALARTASDLPVRNGGVHGSAVHLVAVPRNIEQLRHVDPDAAHRWRGAMREVLHPLMSGGGRIVGFDQAEGYLVVNTPVADAVRTGSGR